MLRRREDPSVTPQLGARARWLWHLGVQCGCLFVRWFVCYFVWHFVVVDKFTFYAVEPLGEMQTSSLCSRTRVCKLDLH